MGKQSNRRLHRRLIQQGCVIVSELRRRISVNVQHSSLRLRTLKLTLVANRRLSLTHLLEHGTRDMRIEGRFTTDR